MSTPQDVITWARMPEFADQLSPEVFDRNFALAQSTATSVLDALTRAGYAVVKLPEPDAPADKYGEVTFDSGMILVDTIDDPARIYLQPGDPLTAEQVEGDALVRLAAARFAAAQAVTRDQ